MATGWQLKGKVLVACNCDWGCPCNFNALPTTGKCEGGWTWHVEEGEFQGITLDGLTFSVFVNWPAAIHEGNGEGLILIDENADPAQRDAIQQLVGGSNGGPWGVLSWTWPTVHGPYFVAYEIAFNGVNTRIKCGETLEIEGAPIRNPVTGVESHPGVLLPEGIIFKQGDLGTSSRFRVSSSVDYDHSGKYLAVGSFEYAAP
ncbi:MAG TPA: DUF1326 domain-containing protein [Gemmatimonadaceae bacterium]|nr:DUF1326 domain-containing protein [Gemmatimonadaceae bacterium]